MIDADGQSRGPTVARPSLALRLAVNIPLTLVLVALVLFQFGAIQTLRVSSINMVPTLEPEDRVMVRAYGSEPLRGDVVVYRSPFDPGHLQLGRIVGVPGDRVELGDGGLAIDGRTAEVPVPGACAGDACPGGESGCAAMGCDGGGCGRAECLVGAEALGDHRFFTRRATGIPALQFSSVTVPDEHYFILSDNRVDERDSRIYGTIPHHAVVGVLAFVYYARDETGIRWDRISRPVS